MGNSRCIAVIYYFINDLSLNPSSSDLFVDRFLNYAEQDFLTLQSDIRSFSSFCRTNGPIKAHHVIARVGYLFEGEMRIFGEDNERRHLRPRSLETIFDLV